MTLDKTWEECLRMWKWIVEQDRPTATVFLKQQWLTENGYDVEQNEIKSSCFFCEYDKRHTPTNACNCHFCPGVKVDTEFSCMISGCDYHNAPIFYAKLLELNKIRLDKKAKRKLR